MDTVSIAWFVFFSGIAVFFAHRTWKKYRLYIGSKILLSLYKVLSNNKKESYMNDNGKVICITYTRLGKEYKVNIPYRKDIITKMNRSTIFLSTDKFLVNVTQQPGVPYFLKAQELGGDHYIIRSSEDDTDTFLSPDEIPFQTVGK